MWLKQKSVINYPADKLWRLLKTTASFKFVVKGILITDAANLPFGWEGGQVINTRIRPLGIAPGWLHSLTVLKVDDETHTITTQECGGPLKLWNHIIKVNQLDSTKATYVDEIELEARLFTPVLWLSSYLFFKYRHWRMKQLVERLTRKPLRRSEPS
jgi:hypothetical protein